MAVGYRNIFPLPDANDYSCAIYKYERSHMGLYLEVSNNHGELFYLYFVGVRYFSGPPSWKGAYFQLIQKPEKQIDVLREIDFFALWPEDMLLNRLQVYKANNPDKPNWGITIVAGEVEKMDKPV